MYARTPFRRGKRSWALVPLALGTLALTAACGSAGGMSPAASAATGAAVSTADTSLGTILVNGSGRTLYEFDRDTGTTSTCDSVCAIDWPPVTAPNPLPTSLSGVSGELGSTARGDGTRQLTIAGHPVYTYSGDDKAGQTNGQGLTLNGGLWSAVSPTGSPVGAGTSSTQSPTQSPSY